MVRGLARRNREAAAQSIPFQISGAAARGKDEGRKKKRTNESGVTATLANLAASLPRENQVRRAATWAAREWSGIATSRLRIEDVAKLVSKWEAQLATSTAYAYTRALRRILTMLERHHGAPPFDDNEIPAPKYPGPRVQIATDEEIAAALRIASPAMKTVLLLCADCGLRSNEAVSIAPEHYSAETKTLTWKVKGGWSRSLPVTDRLAAWLAMAPEDSPSTPFAAAFHQRRFTQTSAHWHWRDIKHRAGIRPEIRLHDLRRTLATKAYRETKDLFAVQQLLGHHSLEATLKYIAPFDAPALQPLLEALKVPQTRRSGQKGKP